MFQLGTRSRRELEGVHPDLVRVVMRAIEITDQDFGVHDGIRTKAEQRELVDRGASKTMDSRHIPGGPDQVGHAVDLVPWILGRFRWKWIPIYSIADAVRQASRELVVPVTWGACWDRELAAEDGPPEEVAARYAARRRAAGRRPFLDGPHFQLPRRIYP